MEKVKKESLIKYAVLGSFCILTLVLIMLRAPFWDEANAWMISKSFNLFDLIFHIEKYDGHLFIWHGLIMPFAKFDFFYPYPMYILNWIFCVFALVVFWNKAPFSVLEKSLITFSYPFVWYFGIVARCYSIGILFLFLILSFWKERLKRPYLISLLIILLANTSAMALVGAFSLGLIFLFDLIKERDYKKIVYSILILGFGAISVFVQLWGARFPGVSPLDMTFVFIQNVIHYFFSYYKKDPLFVVIIDKLISLTVIASYIASIFYFARDKNKKAFFFFVSANLLLTFIFLFKYAGNWWHYLFFFVYFISAIWLYRLYSDKTKADKFFKIVFLALLMLFCAKTLIFKVNAVSFIYDSKSGEIARIIKKENLINNDTRLYALDDYHQRAIEINPYFKDLKVYTQFGCEKYTKEGYLYNLIPFAPDNKNLVDYFANSIDESKNNKGIMKEVKYAPFKNKGIKYTLIYEPLYINRNPDFTIFKIEKIKNGEG